MKSRLQRYLDGLPTFQAHGEGLSLKEKIDIYELQLQGLDSAARKINSVVNNLDNFNLQWNTLIQQVAPEEGKEEESIYDRLLQEEGSSLLVLERGREACDDLESRREVVKTTLHHLCEGSSRSATTPNQQPSGQNTAVRLLKLELKQFYGDLNEWPEFWANFQAAVDNREIPNIQKLCYLLSCLNGKAYSAIAGYAVIPENYTIVLEDLKSRFGDQAEIKRLLYAELKKLPSVDQTKITRTTLDGLERILRQLENMGENRTSAAGIHD